MEKDIDRIPKNPDTDIIIRVDDFGGRRGLTIREFVRGERYTGFTKAGTKIPAEHFKAFKAAINSIDEKDLMEAVIGNSGMQKTGDAGMQKSLDTGGGKELTGSMEQSAEIGKQGAVGLRQEAGSSGQKTGSGKQEVGQGKSDVKEKAKKVKPKVEEKDIGEEEF